jgi:hypothetical protein
MATVTIQSWRWPSRLGVVLLWVLARDAHANPDMTISTVEHGDWPSTIVALQAGNDENHPQIHIKVWDDLGQVPCSQYVLHPDEISSKAFSVGTCDPATGVTTLVLQNRHELFQHGGGLAQPIIPVMLAMPPPPPPPPPEPPKPRPPVISSCWGVVGPTITDPETHEQIELDPIELMPTVRTHPVAYVQVVSFDHAWLLRVKKDTNVREIEYALVPWSSGKHGPSAEVPMGIVYNRLALTCENDPLGDWKDGYLQVPRRAEVTTPDGKKLVLERHRADGALWAQVFTGRGIDALGGLGLLIMVPFTLGSATGIKNEPASFWRAFGAAGACLGVTVAGLVMEFTAYPELSLRHGTDTVDELETTEASTAPSAEGTPAPTSNPLTALHFEGPSLVLDRSSAQVGLAFSF